MERVSLPIKTKIAAWWMIVLGVLTIKLFSQFFSPIPQTQDYMGGLAALFARIIFAPITLIIAIVFFISGSLIFRRRKLGWWLSTITVLPLGYFILIFSFGFLRVPANFDYLLSFIILYPFVLLLLDRKNFWKIAK